VAVAIFAEESTPVNATEQARFQPLYASMLRALKLQGAAKKTVDAYARVVRLTAAFFDRCPDDLTAEDLNQSKKLIGYYQGKTPGYGGGD
jgi:hypothetical protein